MDQGPLRRLLKSLRRTAGPTNGSPDDDGQLLHRFLTNSDHNAFELLLWRHGPMVLGVCRRVLRNENDAEDAFQATFLTLIKKGRSIAAGAALGCWLYRVAYRVALRLRTDLDRRARRERAAVEQCAAPAAALPEEDLRGVLDEEISRLPARHRAAFVLCCLEGKTGVEAARELGCPPGTVSSRLTRARAQLQRRLASRGLAPSAGILAATLAGDGLAASVPGVLVHVTLHAARLFAAGEAAGGVLSQQVITLVEGVLRAMSVTRLKIVTLVLLVVGLFAAGTVLTRPGIEAAPAQPAQQGAVPQEREKPRQGKAGKEGAVEVEVVKPRPGGLAQTTTQAGSVEPFQRADIVAPVAGFLSKIQVDLGDRVKKGQVLAEIDVPLLALQEKQAAIAVQQARGQMEEAQAREVAAKAQVDAGKKLIAQREAEVKRAHTNLEFRQIQHARIQALVKSGSVDQRIYDEAFTHLETARTSEQAAKAAVESAKGDVEVLQAKRRQAEAALQSARLNVESAQIGLEQARVRLNQLRILAPFDGVVTQRNYSPGDYLRPGDQAPQRPLLTIMSTGRYRVVVHVPDFDVPLVKPGQPAQVIISNLPGVRIACKVSRIGYAQSETNRTMRAELDVSDPKEQLRPGMFGEVTIRLQKGKAGVLRVPAEAVFKDDSDHFVYLVRDGKAHRTGVQVSGSNRDEVEIASGLRPTDLVVVNPGRLRDQVVPVQLKNVPDRK